MGRRRYSKLWAEKYRNPEKNRIHSQPPIVRTAWLELLVLATDAENGKGIIQISEEVGYTDDQLATLINLPVEDWMTAKTILSEIGEIGVLPGNRIRWIRWRETQSEYDRKLAYLESKEQGAEKGAEKGAPKGHGIIEKKKSSRRGEEEGKDLGVSIKTDTPLSVAPTGRALMAYWNAKDQLPKIQTWNEERQKKLRTRAKDPQFCLYWQDAVDALTRSSFHLGENDRHWTADIGYFLGTDRAGNTNWNKRWEKEITEGVRTKRTKEQIEAAERARLEREEQEEATKRGDMTPEGRALTEKLTSIVKGDTHEGYE